MLFCKKRKLNILLLLLLFGVFLSGCSFGGGNILTEKKNEIKQKQALNKQEKQKNKEVNTNIKKDTKEQEKNNLLKNWKVYHDKEYGFEFKYPNNFIANNQCEKNSKQKTICIHNPRTLNYIQSWHKTHKNQPGPQELDMIKISVIQVKKQNIKNNDDLKNWIIKNEKADIDKIDIQKIGKHHGVFVSFASITQDYNFYIANKNIILHFSTAELTGDDKINKDAIFIDLIKSLKIK